MSLFSGVIKDITGAAEKVKAAVLKAVAEVDNVILPETEKLKPTIDAVADALLPGASKYVDYAVALLEDVASALDAGGAAAEQNLQNAGLDAAAIQAVKALIPQLKAVKKAA